MATFAHNGDPGCDSSNWDVLAPYAAGRTRDPATFNPKKLNVSQWFDSITALGANIAILTAKHGCGFGLWPTKAKLPDGSPYGYSVGVPAAAIQHDVLRDFVNAADAAGVGYGFYYSIMKNFYLCRDFNGQNSCLKEVLPGQHNLTDEEHLAVSRQMATELWTEYGNLTEVWVDSGLGGLGELMSQLQPEAVGTPMSPTGWCGTESGYPSRDVGPGDVWSLGDGFFGSPQGSDWVPKFCDPQLFRDHVWFWEPDLEVRTLETMIPIYHDIVGRGMVMEIAFSVDRDGLVQDTHAAVYKQLGNWARACYGSPLATSSGVGWTFEVDVPAGSIFDRFMLQEDIVLGQRVWNYTVESQVEGGGWEALLTGQAIGRKRIQLLKSPITASASLKLRLNVQHAAAQPAIKSFGVFKPCSTQSLTILA